MQRLARRLAKYPQGKNMFKRNQVEGGCFQLWSHLLTVLQFHVKFEILYGDLLTV